MSTPADKSNSFYILNDLEQKFWQLNFENEFKAYTVKTIEDNLNDCLKCNILLEHELEQERLDTSKLKIELATLTANMNKSNDEHNNSSVVDVNVMVNDCEYLSNKIYEIQLENIELKQELTKSNDQLFQLMKTQNAYSENIDSMISSFNSLKQQIKILDNKSHVLVKVSCITKILAKLILKAIKYNEKLNNIQFYQIQQLIKEVTIINSKIHKLIYEIEKNEITKIEEKNAVAFDHQTHLKMHKKLIEILEIENDTLHKILNQISKRA